MSTKVWIVKDGGHDYADAASFGKVEFLFGQRTYPFGKLEALQEELDRCDVGEGDYFLPSGSIMLNIIAVMWWNQKFGSVKDVERRL